MPVSYDAAPRPMKVRKVANLLACSPYTVRKLIRGGHLPAFRVGPGRTAFRVHAADLVAFAAQYGHHAPADVAAGAVLPALQPRPVELVMHRRPDGLTLITPYKPPDGLED